MKSSMVTNVIVFCTRTLNAGIFIYVTVLYTKNYSLCGANEIEHLVVDRSNSIGILYSTNQPTMYLAVEAQTERATHVPPTSRCDPELKIRASPPNTFLFCYTAEYMATQVYALSRDLLLVIIYAKVKPLVCY